MKIKLLASLLCLSLLLLLGGCAAPTTETHERPSDSPPASSHADPRVEEKTVAEIAEEMAAGRISSEELVSIYLERIESIDRSGPTLRSVLALNPRAMEDARALDEERARGEVRGPLHGIPVLLKDNIEMAGGLPTTAGSLALADNVGDRDAPIVARLREAGVVFLGKTNLSEWANIRSTQSTSGWSAVGGLTRNPYALDRNACGSSAGSGVAVAANLTMLAVGTETDGSVICPAAVNGIVGLKPTVGLLSRRYIVPVSHSQDTAGPMTRTVADAAAMLTAMAGTDEQDPATAEADRRKEDYTAGLSEDALEGVRLGLMRFATGYLPALDREFDRARARLIDAGAVLVDIHEFDTLGQIYRNELTVLLSELKTDLNLYLADAAPAVATRTLEDVITFNETWASREMRFFRQEHFEQAQETEGVEGEDYLRAVEENRRLAGPEGIDRLLHDYRVEALIAPSTGPAWVTDLVNGDHYLGSATTLPAVAGYPHLTVPMGDVNGLPVGLSFIGPAWSEARLLAMGFAFERKMQGRTPPTFAPSIETHPDVAPGLTPPWGQVLSLDLSRPRGQVLALDRGSKAKT